MSDYELYGDYNEVDEPPKKNGMGLAIKITALVACFAVVGFIAFRLIAFNHYPSNIKNIYYTDNLTAYYNATDGNIGALTQELRAPYDDEKLGNFFASNLIVIKEIGEIQISVRYNTALYNKLGLEFSFDDMTFSLQRSGGDENATGALAGIPLDAKISVCATDKYLMYRYAKIVIEGVDFGEGEDAVEWLRLDMKINGLDSDEPFMLCIYENNEAHSSFSEYKLSGKEKLK